MKVINRIKGKAYKFYSKMSIILKIIMISIWYIDKYRMKYKYVILKLICMKVLINIKINKNRLEHN